MRSSVNSKCCHGNTSCHNGETRYPEWQTIKLLMSNSLCLIYELLLDTQEAERYLLKKMNCLTWFRVHFTKFFRALWVMFVFHSNKVMYSWKIRLDRINCFNYVCGLTDLIISALVIFGKSLSGFLSSFLIIQDVSVFAVYSYMWKHNEHVRKSKICIVLTGDIKLITCSCSWVLWIMLERNWSFWGNSAFWGWILFYGSWYCESRLPWRGVAYCFF